MKGRVILTFFLFFCAASVLFHSCSPKYHQFISEYNFKSPNGEPDYGDLKYWAAHPYKKDPSDSIPFPLRSISNDSSVDVFFLQCKN